MALKRATQIGAASCQIFVKNNMQWMGKPYSPSDLEAFRKERTAANLGCIFGHTGYLINFGAPPSPNRDRSLQSLIQELELAESLELPFLVLHPGAHLGAGEAEGLKRIVAGLNEAFSATRKSKVGIALENTAGQGTCLGYRLEHLAEIKSRVKQPKRIGVCLDTAHFLASGYDIRSPKGWDDAIARLDELMGINQILAFHLNDSKTALSSRVDRHEHIGRGQIGKDGFRHIVNDPRFSAHPGCLETPKGPDLKEDIENLGVLRSLLASGKTNQGLRSSRRK
jgi:deoxyribonuclease-4